MRNVEAGDITAAVRKMCIDSNYLLPPDLACALKNNYDLEPWPLAKEVLGDILENIKVSKEENLPLCQDTGMACVFVEIGQDVHVTGGSLENAINEGVRQGYKNGFLRKSVVGDPLKRINTGDNSPAVINYKIVEGENIFIRLSPKGFGSENMSRVKMCKPSDGEKGVVDFVLETVALAGSNPCPPIIVGVGIGGTFDKVTLLAKEALLRPVDKQNADFYYADMERDLLKKINELGIGPQGFGGKATALAVNIETFPTHIAGLPVAVNISCHVTRHAEIRL